MKEVIASVLGVLIGGVITVVTLYFSGSLERFPRLRLISASKAFDGFLYLWPILLFGLGFAIAYYLNPRWDFPSAEFYRAASEVIVLLLIGLIFEREVVARIGFWQRFEYGLILIAGEAAAFLAVSESLPDADANSVGGTEFMTVLLSTLTVAALLAATILAVAALISRGAAPAPPPVEVNQD
jgi:hypothetical protein